MEYEQIDKLRAGLANRIRRTNESITGPLLTPKPPIVSSATQGEGQYVWAALVPMALAVGLMLSANTPPDQQRTTMQARVSHATQRPSPMPFTLDDLQLELDAQPATSVAAPIRRRRPVRQVKLARAFVLTPQPLLFSIEQPILMQPAIVETAFLNDISFDDSEALSLVTADPILSPPPKKRMGFRRFFAALAMPFRMLAGVS